MGTLEGRQRANNLSDFKIHAVDERFGLSHSKPVVLSTAYGRSCHSSTGLNSGTGVGIVDVLSGSDAATVGCRWRSAAQ